MWDEGLTGSVTTLRVLDENGEVNAEYSGPYTPVLTTLGQCYAPAHVQIAHTPSPDDPSEQTSCIVSGVEEFCLMMVLSAACTSAAQAPFVAILRKDSAPRAKKTVRERRCSAEL